MSCEFAHDDASYVLGSLSPAERSAYRLHLSGCVECTLAVQSLVGLPGLLGRISADVLESPLLDEPVPDTLLPALVGEVRRTQRRRRWVVAAAAAAAAVILTAGSLAIGGALNDDSTPVDGSPSPDTTATGQAMVPVGSEPLSAELAMTSVAWGTRLDLTCTYRGAEGDHEGWAEWSYVMFVRTLDGDLEQVATWRALPGKTMQLAAATAMSREDIASVEIRTVEGKPVLKLVA